ncbi:MAG: GNAT family N-acetyltransferase [Candidatus Pristimantibacillus lignocellulolyticus]|uniref:GNAT family N-acetyltransferase n=1 Tax=Candidatus Pristimantibacillus lignocellulolyticus TaxID=2994561 RepID=A0A9J6ZC76_9BACL|nr:MAG: GNAT family N-acetyltransferase [Candidatus Pristimantibacillus lignocellulolyticus]
MNNYSIKQAAINDLEKLSELFDLYRIFYDQNSDISGAKHFLCERIKRNESIIFIVEETENKEFIGFTQLYPSFSSISMQRSWILNDLFVKIERRGNGIAKLLLDKAYRYAKETSSKGLSLSTSISNDRAQKIYEEFGFIKDEEFYHYFKSV